MLCYSNLEWACNKGKPQLSLLCKQTPDPTRVACGGATILQSVWWSAQYLHNPLRFFNLELRIQIQFFHLTIDKKYMTVHLLEKWIYYSFQKQISGDSKNDLTPLHPMELQRHIHSCQLSISLKEPIFLTRRFSSKILLNLSLFKSMSIATIEEK